MTNNQAVETLKQALTVIRTETGEVDLYTHTLLIFLHVAHSGKRGITGSELEAKLKMATSSVFRNTRILAGGREGSTKALGLVQVEEDPLERRRKVFTLTTKGEQLVSKLAEKVGGTLTT
jgi:DNA-binding MarR family transcriptional regulator